MVEHTPWRGPSYKTGIGGQKLAIVGYSHYLQPDDTDDDDFTRQVIIKDVLDRKRDLFFFNQIAGYFGMDLDFWQHVIFFNFLPACIGFVEDKFREGTPHQLALGKVRALKVINDEKPDKVFVFTKKGWLAFPPTDQSFPPEFRWGTYQLSGHPVTACGLRHPQGADGEMMRKAVGTVMAMPYRGM